MKSSGGAGPAGLGYQASNVAPAADIRGVRHRKRSYCYSAEQVRFPCFLPLPTTFARVSSYSRVSFSTLRDLVEIGIGGNTALGTRGFFQVTATSQSDFHPPFLNMPGVACSGGGRAGYLVVWREGTEGRRVFAVGVGPHKDSNKSSLCCGNALQNIIVGACKYCLKEC